MKEGRDREKDISPDIIFQAKENLILRRETHIHQLADKLKEDRVKHVIEPILVGSKEPEKLSDEDIDYVVDLGLIQKKPYLRIANSHPTCLSPNPSNPQSQISSASCPRDILMMSCQKN
ncbi:MAG: hypothetical protein PVH61_20415 [Candidatus Aminicenantes bacterium]|jgi:hypothetical protein